MLGLLTLLTILAPATLTPSTAPATQPASGWKLVFSDEFDRAGAPDPSKWAYETGMIRNHEAQLYTDDRRENARVEDDHLIIEARREDTPVPNHSGQVARYTAASLTTQGHAAWRYGRVEVRAKIPVGVGNWPAIWMLPDRIGKVPWPACGEIDIMENVGFDPHRIHQSIHTQAYNHTKNTQKSAITPVQKVDADFHVYAMEWTPEEMTMSIDGTEQFRFANEHKTEAEWPFDHPFHLKLNLAVGGDWGGQKGIDESAFPSRFLVDYVRVYQQQPRP
jgi:beta-glucanase (GH16 family)